MRHLDISNWPDRLVKEVVDLGVQLDTLYPQQHLAAVGQSAAWLVYAAGEIRTQAGQPKNISMIPFSGRFMKKKSEMGDLAHFVTDHTAYPTAQNQSEYFNFLATQKSAPADILAQYDNGQGAKTVFIDFTDSGAGFASFIDTWYGMDKDVDQDDLKAATSFHCLMAPHIQLTSERIMIDSALNKGLVLPLQHNDVFRTTTLFNLAGSKGEEQGHLGSDRLVPSYDISAYGQGKLLATHNEGRIAAIKRAFGTELKRESIESRRAKSASSYTGLFSPRKAVETAAISAKRMMVR